MFDRTGIALTALASLALGTPALSQTATVTTGLVDAVSVEPEVVLSPSAQLMKATLEAGGASFENLKKFYAAQGFEPVWTDQRRSALTQALVGADDHGLPVARYDLSGIGTRAASGSDEIVDDITLSQIFLRYARDVNSGLLEPKSIDREIHVFPKRPDEVALLEGLTQANDPADFIRALAPTHPHYVGLMGEKKRLERLMSREGWGEPVPAGPTLKPGQSGPRVAAMRARIDVLMGTDLGTSEEFDPDLVEAVKAFQDHNGLNADGVAGPRTLGALNASPEDRLKQVLVNLERQRWLNFDRGPRHIYVNQADFRVHVIENGTSIFESRTVIGKNGHRTQEFSDEMTHMVVNPTWHVPRSIATEEYLPQLKRNPKALSGRGIQVMTRGGTAINPALVDFTQFNKRNFPFIMKQPPSRGNALGRVKFMFPNQFNIYLHDTPSKSLFNRDTRAFSHGCVRVQKPFDLAHVLLAPQADNPEATFQSYLGSGRERHVNLATPVPVHLTYHTAWVDEDGLPQYRGDVYGRDGRVFSALERAGVTLPQVEG